MKTHIAIVDWTQLNRIAKFRDFGKRGDADKHVTKYGGFVVSKPNDNPRDWLIDPVAKTVSIDVLPPVPGPTVEEIYNRSMQNKHVLKAVVSAYIKGKLTVGMTPAQAKAAIKAQM